MGEREEGSEGREGKVSEVSGEEACTLLSYHAAWPLPPLFRSPYFELSFPPAILQHGSSNPESHPDAQHSPDPGPSQVKEQN